MTNKQGVRIMYKKHCFIYLFLFSLSLMGEELINFKPDLKVGKSWAIEVNKYTSPRETAEDSITNNFIPELYTLTYQYKVVNIFNNHYVISIKLIKTNNKKIGKLYDFFQIFINKQNFSLLEIKHIDVKSGKVLASQKYKDGVINNITGWVSSLPLAFPVFSNKPITKQKEKNYYTIKSNALVQQFNYGLNKNNQAFLHIEIFDDQSELPRIFQNWEQGKPWWSIAYYSKGGQKFKAILIEQLPQTMEEK